MATTASMRGLRRVRALAAYAVLAVLAVWTLGPLYWMVTTSLKTNREVYGTEATLWPREPTLANYRVLFTQDALRRLLPEQHASSRWPRRP